MSLNVKALTCGFAAAVSGVSPALAQETKAPVQIGSGPGLSDRFDLGRNVPVTALGVTRDISADKRHQITVKIGERPLTVEEKPRSFRLSQDLGEMGEARLKFMKVEWRIKFGGPK